MKPTASQLKTIHSLQAIQRDLNARFVGREEAVTLLVLAVVAREHVLLIGPPGTAKTDLIQRFADLINASRFSYLLTRFTEPSEIFGPLDFEQFQAGTYRIKTQDMLPSAEVVFLDEVFQGSSAILNTLLTLINERRFHNGAQLADAPLISLFGASSELPEDPALRAFSDRFLLRLQVRPVGSVRLTELLDRGWKQERERQGAGSSPPALQIKDLAELSDILADVDLEPVRPELSDLIGELLAQGITLSDRRIVRAQRLVAAAALLREDGVASQRDLWPLAHLWTEQSDAAPVRDAVYERISADSGGPQADGRSPDDLEALAKYTADQVADKPGVAARASVITALKTLGELLTQARTRYPTAGSTHIFIRKQQDRVSLLLEK